MLIAILITSAKTKKYLDATEENCQAHYEMSLPHYYKKPMLFGVYVKVY